MNNLNKSANLLVSFALVSAFTVVCFAQQANQRDESKLRLDTDLVVVDSQILELLRC